MHIIWFVAILLALPSLALSQPRSGQTWQPATILSDSINVNCDELLLPNILGRLLNDATPTTTCGEMCQSLRSPHPIHIELQPQTGTSDNLTSITGCAIDTVKVQLSIADSGDSITIVDTPGSIELPGNQSITIDETIEIVTLISKDGVWILDGGFGSGGGGSGGGIIPDGGKIDMRTELVLNTPTEGFFPPGGNSCIGIGAIGFGQFCANFATKTFWMGTGTTSEEWGTGTSGGGGGGGHCNGATLDGFANRCEFKDTDGDGCAIWVDTEGPHFECFTDLGGANTPVLPAELKTFNISPGKWFADGTHFVHQTNAVINTETVRDALITADHDSATIKTYIGMPDRWDGVTLRVYAFVHTKETTPAGDIQINWAGYCVENDGINGAGGYPASGTDGVMLIDLDGKVTHDKIIAGTAGNVPFNNNCTSGNKKGLWLRGVVNAGGTTADDSGTNPILSDQIFLDFQVEYGLKSYTD